MADIVLATTGQGTYLTSRKEHMAKEPKSKLPNLLSKVEDLLKKELSQLSVQELGIPGNAIVGSIIQR